MRGRRWTTVVVATALALVGLVGVNGAPAAADPQGGTLQGVYFDGEFCNDYGWDGAQAGRWDWYYCEYRQYGSSSVYYFLWTFNY
jgi:hypothetical protein